MYKLLFDSDALIKVAKAEFLETTANVFQVCITDDVYHEAVEQGRRKLYEDADKIKGLIDAKKIFVIKSNKYAKEAKPRKSFGKGEISVFQAYKKNYLIVADDLSFVACLNDESIKNMSSAHVLMALLKKRKIGKEKAYYHLDKLKPLIRKETYELVKSDIKGE